MEDRIVGKSTNKLQDISKEKKWESWEVEQYSGEVIEKESHLVNKAAGRYIGKVKNASSGRLGLISRKMNEGEKRKLSNSKWKSKKLVTINRREAKLEKVASEVVSDKGCKMYSEEELKEMMEGGRKKKRKKKSKWERMREAEGGGRSGGGEVKIVGKLFGL